MAQPVDPVVRSLFFSSLAVGILPPTLVALLFEACFASYSPSGYLPLVAIAGMIPMSLCARLVVSANKRHDLSAANFIGAIAALAIVNLSMALILELDMLRDDPSSTGGLVIPIMVALAFAAVKVGWQAGKNVSKVLSRGG